MKLSDKIILTEKMIKLIKQEFGTEKCPDFSFGCCNCRAFVVLSWLDSYRWDLKHELKQNKILKMNSSWETRRIQTIAGITRPNKYIYFSGIQKGEEVRK